MKNIVLFLLLMPVFTYAKNIAWDGSSSSLKIGDKVEILEDKDGAFTYKQVSSDEYQDKFTPSDKDNLSLGYTDAYFWLRFTINNQTSNNIILELAQAGLPQANLYYEVNNKPVKEVKSGYEVGMDAKQIRSSYQVFELPPGKITCYIQLNSNSEPVPINIFSEKQFEQESTYQKIGYGIYCGLMIFVILNNIFIYISLKKRLYLFYALIVLVYIAYSAAVIDGFIVYFIPNVNLKLLYTTIPALGVILQTWYCLTFLEVKRFAPKIYNVVKGIIIYFSIWFIIKFFLPFSIVQPLNTVHALISFFTMAYVGIRVGIYGNKMGFYFAIAYLFYFLLVGVQAFYINTGAPAYLGGLSFVAYATLIEAFLLSYLLSRRYEWEKKEIENEKYEAQLIVIEKTKENERIIEGQKAILKKQVEARTLELQTSNDRLIDLNREKDGLVNIVAHDLKSPLSTIIGFTELLKVDGTLNKKQNEFISVIDSVAQDGMYLIGDLLDVHSYELGDSEVNLTEFDLSSYMTDWQKTFDQQLIKKRQKLQVKLDIDNANINTDHFLLGRILNNLMSNAIKFSERNKGIDVTVEESELTVDFSVKDEGPGISREDQLKMFKRFQKLSARPTNSESSNGLGLSIIKTLADKLKAQIIVNSKLGEGTEFIVKFPKINL